VPSFQAIQPELVSRDLLPQAALLNGANMNVARAVGPALGGALSAVLRCRSALADSPLPAMAALVVGLAWISVQSTLTRHRPDPAARVDPCPRAGVLPARVHGRLGAGRARLGSGGGSTRTPTWYEHLRQHLERGTVMDQQIEATARALAKEAPFVERFVGRLRPPR
jgi:hypothetical protein